MRRIITIELEYDADQDETFEAFSAYSPREILEYGVVVYDEIEEDDFEDGPDDDSTGFVA